MNRYHHHHHQMALLEQMANEDRRREGDDHERPRRDLAASTDRAHRAHRAPRHKYGTAMARYGKRVGHCSEAPLDTQDENTYSCKCAQNAHERYRFARCLPANAARFPPSTWRSPPVRSGRRLPSMQKRAAKSLVTSATFRCTPFAASGEHIK